MSAATLLFGALALAGLGLSAFNYYRSPLASRTKTLVLLGLDTLAAVLLALAFFEPTLPFDRLESSKSSTIILLDRSRSMEIFDPDSVTRFIDNVKKQSPRGDFALLWFGDSLREATQTISPPQDRRSFLPYPFGATLNTPGSKIIVVSDGNWSNASLGSPAPQLQSCAWVRLPPAAPKPFLSLQPRMASIIGTEKYADTLLLDIRGYIPDTVTILLEARRDGSRVLSQQLRSPAGMLAETVRLIIPPAGRGRHTISIGAQMPGDSLPTTVSVVQTTLPGRLTFASAGAPTRLDNRFVRLAFHRDTHWEPIKADREPDLLILFDWSDSSIAHLKRYPRSALLLCGAVPPQLTPQFTTANRPLDSTNAPRQFDPQSYPPLNRVLHLDKTFLTSPRTLIFAASSDTLKKPVIPLIQTGFWQNRPTMVLLTTEIWKWDFLLFQSVAAATERPFSATIPSAMLAHIATTLSPSLIVYPVSTPLFEGMPIQLGVGLPGRLALDRPATITFNVSSTDNSRLFDTTQSFAGPISAPLTLRSLPTGQLFLQASLQQESRHFSYSDTLFVEPDRSEYDCLSQNTVLLDQIGMEIEATPEAINAFTAEHFDTGRNADRTALRIQRSPLLLVFILLPLCLAWMLRRKWKLD